MKDALYTLRSNMVRIEGLVQSLDCEWQGIAEKQYAQRIILVRSEFDALEKVLEQLTDQLDRISDEYEEHEDILAEKIRRIY